MTDRAAITDKIILAVYLILFAVFACILMYIQPFGDIPPAYPNPPDEFSRFLIPQYIFDTGHIPTGFEESVRIPGYGGAYAFMPILPYIIMGYLMRAVGFFAGQAVPGYLIARSVNVIFGLIMAYVVYLIGKRVFDNLPARWLFCFLVMFWPEQLFLHTYVNCESLSQLSVALIILALVKIRQDGADMKNSVLLGVALALCLLSYYNAYGYICAAVILFLLWPEKDLKRHVPVAAAVTVAGAGWWFVRNLIVLKGDLFGLSTMSAERARLGVVLPPTFKEQGKSIVDMFTETDLFSRMLKTFICSYGSASIDAGPGLYAFYKVFLFGGTVLALFFAIRGFGKRDKSVTVWYLAIIGAMLSVFVLWLYYSYAMDYQPQGRYLLATVIPLFYFLVKAWTGAAELVRIRGRIYIAGVALAVLLIVFWEADFIFGTVIPFVSC